jgi:hypothetical protein
MEFITCGYLHRFAGLSAAKNLALPSFQRKLE